MEKIPNRLSRFSNIVLFGLLLTTILLTMVSIVSYTGTHRWLVEWQLEKFGEYYPFYSAVVTSLIHLVIAVLVGVVLVKLNVIRGESEIEPIHRNAEFWQSYARGSTNVLRNHKYRVVFIGVGFIFLCSGAADIFVGLTSGELTELDVTSLEQGKKPASRYVSFSQARILNEFSLYVEDRKNNETEYTPLVSNSWTKEKPVTIFLEREVFRSRSPKPSPTGVLRWPGPSAMVLASFDKHGVKTVAMQNAWRIEWGKTPDRLVFMGIVSTIMGGLMIGITSLYWWIKG